MTNVRLVNFPHVNCLTLNIELLRALIMNSLNVQSAAWYSDVCVWTEVDQHGVSRFRRGRVLHCNDQRDLEGAKRDQGAQVSGQGRGSSPAPAVALRAVDCCGTGPHVQVKLGSEPPPLSTTRRNH